jgi:hypothetical protein
MCTIAEKTASAGSYRREILGAILAQLILHAAVQGRMGPYPIAAIDCDNLGVVRHGNKPWRPLSTTQPQADILKILKQYIAHQPFASKFLYVPSQADDIKSWKECSLKERINIKVDSLTKKALWYAHALEKYFDGQFPKEDFRIYTNGEKVTGQIRPALKEYWGRATARTFPDQKNIVPQEEFDTVWWMGVKKVMASYPKMFRIFITKQVSGWCGSNSKRSLWDTSISNICPNCGPVRETSKHLTWCKHVGRVQLFRESTQEVITCLENANVDPILIDIIKSYLHGQGTVTMESCVCLWSSYLQMSQSQD